MMKKIVTVGGGTGTFTLLRGLKKYTSSLIAIFTMFDSGGSTGKLIDEFGYLPPGDIRRGILALTPESSETRILRDLFNYRFTKGNGLAGHNFGNILLTALKDITGDELAAIEEASKLFNIKGRVLPVTLDSAHLCAELESGEVIVIGPGDLYSSVIPNLLVEGFIETVRESKAKKVFVCNVMTKNGETNDFKASDFLDTIENYIGKGILTHFIVNNEKVSNESLKKYSEENATQVEADNKLIERKDIIIIRGNFINENDIVRHDSNKLARAII